MIKLILLGGLGNQMFEYAAAKSLAMRLGKSISIDLYGLNQCSSTAKRECELEIFELNLPLASSWRSKLFVKGRKFVIGNIKLFSKLGFFGNWFAIEYLPVFENLKGNIFLCGYFQNQRYFQNIEYELRQDFKFNCPLEDLNLDLAQSMAKETSISVHMRRGDYISDEDAASNFVNCGKIYYENAIECINKKLLDVVFYVFSDDIDWAKEQIDFGLSKVIYISHNKGRDSYIDMQLMSLCKHNIIANSTFSWWAAWLNDNKNKIVLVPEKWYTNDNKNMYLDEFYSSDWIKISLQ